MRIVARGSGATVVQRYTESLALSDAMTRAIDGRYIQGSLDQVSALKQDMRSKNYATELLGHHEDLCMSSSFLPRAMAGVEDAELAKAISHMSTKLDPPKWPQRTVALLQRRTVDGFRNQYKFDELMETTEPFTPSELDLMSLRLGALKMVSPHQRLASFVKIWFQETLPAYIVLGEQRSPTALLSAHMSLDATSGRARLSWSQTCWTA